MTDYLTEQEQVELLKKWVKQYGLVILGGIVIALLLSFGWRYWQQRQENILNQASMQFEAMMSARAQTDPQLTLEQAKKIFANYPKTAYGSMAALMLARDALVKNEYSEASNKLNWVIAHSNIAPLRQIAKIRLARILIGQDRAQEALTLLNKIDDVSFTGMIKEVRGDAFYALKEFDKARDAYQQALTDLPNAEVARPLLQMKYDNLAT